MTDLMFMALVTFAGIPAVLSSASTLIRVIRAFPGASQLNGFRTLLITILVVLVSMALLPYLAVLAGELYVQATCAGAGCAQGGVGLVMVTPLPWLVHFAIAALAKIGGSQQGAKVDSNSQ